jgi:hypothetical protein
MGILVSGQAVTLTAAQPIVQSPLVAIDQLTDRITISLQLPTTAQPLSWTATGICRVTLLIIVDGVQYRAVGRVHGGIHLVGGVEQDTYRLEYEPPYYDPGGPVTIVDGKAYRQAKRIGEGKSSVQARLMVERVAGTINTVVKVSLTTESAAPIIEVHNSVAFDAATSATETLGDGILTLSHTSTGSDRAVFGGASWGDANAGNGSVSMTYGGSGMAEKWDEVISDVHDHAGYTLAGQATGAQDVTHDVQSTEPTYQFLGVVSFTGVDQTTPVGTAATAIGTTTGPATVTVASVSADDMVVESMRTESLNPPTIGANQTIRNTQTASNRFHRQSTQLGSDGGVMSWTLDGPDYWGIGAIAFKAAAGGAGGTDGWKVILH